MARPAEFEDAFRADVFQDEREKAVRYITSVERLAIKRGIEKGLKQGLRECIALALETKFGEDSRKLLRRVRAVDDVASLRALSRALKTASTLEEVRQLLPKRPKANGGSK
jgi:hypothetical protein